MEKRKKKNSAGNIFKQEFKAPEEGVIYKTFINGFSIQELQHYTPISLAAANKENIKRRGTAKEWVDSYTEAAIALSKINQERCCNSNAEARNKIENPYIRHSKYVFFSYQLTLPIIFLTRHAAELALKEAIELAGGKLNNQTHDLIKLWNSLLSNFIENKSPFDTNNITQMHSYLQILSHLDDSGTKVRYATDKDGNYTHNNIEWVDCVLLTNKLKSFIESLRSIDYEYVNYSNPKNSKRNKTSKEN